MRGLNQGIPHGVRFFLSGFIWRGDKLLTMDSRVNNPTILINRILDGDLEAFREIIREYERDAQSVVVALLENREGTRDLVHQTFIRVYQHLSRFDPARGEFRHWVKGIARHVVQGEIRRRARENKRLGIYWEHLRIRSEENDPEGETERLEILRRHVEVCVGKLKGDYARIIEMRYKNGEPMEEIARSMDRTIDTARRLLSRARQLVRSCAQRQMASNP